MRAFADPRDALRKELRGARLRRGLTQAEVSEKLGRPQSFVAKIENGERRLEFTEALRLCAILEIDPKDLIDRLL